MPRPSTTTAILSESRKEYAALEQLLATLSPDEMARPGQASAQPAKAVQPAKRTEPAPGAVTAPTKPVASTPEMPSPVIIQQVGETGPGVRNGNGKTKGTGHPVASADSGPRVRNGNGNGAATTTVIQASATTFWMLANKHTDRLDRATVSALAKDVVTGKMSWLEVQTILHDMIEDNAIPTFGSASGPREPIHEKATTATVQYAEKVSDPLDELFA